MKNVCIIGGGNIGHSLIALTNKNTDYQISLLLSEEKVTSHWGKEIIGEYEDKIFSGMLSKVSNQAEEIIPNSDIVIITVPAFARYSVLKRIIPYLKKDTWVGCIPGSGGVEWAVKELLQNKRINYFALERVPSVARITEYGKKVKINSIRNFINIGVLNGSKKEIACEIEKMFGIRTVILENHFTITLTTSNAILHPTRLYSIFKGNEDTLYNNEILFYEDWADNSSEVFIKCDKEIEKIYEILSRELPKVDFSRNIPLRKYYESETEKELTRKITSIKAFKGIKLKMEEKDGKYRCNFKDRYFTEDIPYGLLMFKAIAELLDINTPNINNVINWAQENMGKEYLINNKINPNNKEGLYPQNSGIKTKEELIKYLNEKYGENCNKII